jgi:hypothetical protein
MPQHQARGVRDAVRGIAANEGKRSSVAVAALILLLLAGCGTRTIRTDVIDQAGLQVFLRHEREGGRKTDRGYQQPSTISSERISHILATIDVTTREGKVTERQPAIHADILERVSSGVARALEDADSSQRVVVMMVRRQQHLVLFHRKFLTSFIVYLRDDSLYLHLSRVEWEVPKRREDNPPEPRLGDRVMDFRVVPARSMYANGAQGVVVNWRDPLFANPVATRRNVRGEVVRRTVLMESAIPREERGGDGIADLPEGLDSEEVSALRVLERARRQGDITEAYYQRRREQLLREGSSP